MSKRHHCAYDFIVRRLEVFIVRSLGQDGWKGSTTNSAATCSKTHKRLNRTLVNQRKQDRMQIFEGILFFKATNNIKTNQSHSCCQMGASGRMCQRCSTCRGMSPVRSYPALESPRDKNQETGCEVICDDPTPPAVKGEVVKLKVKPLT